MKRTVVRRLTVWAVCLALVACNQADYQSIMQNQLRSFLGETFKSYSWISYPTNNFGIGTSFYLKERGDSPTDDRQICATYSCLSTTKNQQPPSDHDSLIKVNGFADIGTGSSLQLTENDKSQILAALNLKKLIQKLTLGAELKIERDLNIVIDIGKAYRRSINKDKLCTFLKQLPPESQMLVAFLEKKLSIVVSDVVIDGFSINVTTSGGVSASLDAKLDSAIGKVLDTDTGLALNVEKTGNGAYLLKAAEPLIVAKLNSEYPIFGNDDSIIEELKKPLAVLKDDDEKRTQPDSVFFEDGWITYHRFQLNKEKPMPFEIGSCPGADCYRFSLGPRETNDSKQIQTIFLEGGGFDKHLEKLPGGGIQLFRLARLDSKGGQYGIPLKQGGHITASLGLFKGASLRLNAIDNDVLFVVEDDRINYLTVGVAIYDGTFCKLYREGKLGRKPSLKEIPECEK